MSLSIGQCVGPAGWKCVKKKIDVFVCFLALRAEAFDLCTVRTLAELDQYQWLQPILRSHGCESTEQLLFFFQLISL